MQVRCHVVMTSQNLSNVIPLAASRTGGRSPPARYSHSRNTAGSQEPRETDRSASIRWASIHAESWAVTWTPRGHNMSNTAWQHDEFRSHWVLIVSLIIQIFTTSFGPWVRSAIFPSYIPVRSQRASSYWEACRWGVWPSFVQNRKSCRVSTAPHPTPGGIHLSGRTSPQTIWTPRTWLTIICFRTVNT